MEERIDLRSRCHVNSNDDGDRFVGVKSDNDQTMIYFPLGYQLPEDNRQLRWDIQNLFRVLSEFTKEDKILNMDKFEAAHSVDYPIYAYIQVIIYYLSNGYYRETEKTYLTATRGPADWDQTFKHNVPLVGRNGSIVYIERTVAHQTPNDNAVITLINKYCVSEAFDKLGLIYGFDDSAVQKISEPENFQPWITLLNDKSKTNEEKKRSLFLAMKAILQHKRDYPNSKTFFFGTDTFETVWEKLINKAFGIDNKDDFLPPTTWHLNYGHDKTKKPLIPDSIMFYNNKYYVLDAKFYRYGRTGMPDHLPNSTDINKQITYGEYLRKNKGIANDSLFNAFLMPFDKNNNLFHSKGKQFLNIGEATGEWRHNKENYEHIQGIVVDTRDLMFSSASGTSENTKKSLAECIESVLGKDPIES